MAGSPQMGIGRPQSIVELPPTPNQLDLALLPLSP